MKTSWTHLSRAAFEDASPQKRQELLWALEHAVQQATLEAVEAAVHDVVGQVSRIGWNFIPIPGELPFSLRDAEVPGGPVNLRVHWMGSTSLVQEPAPPPLTAAQQQRKALQDAFHQAANEAFAVEQERGFAALDPRQRHALLLQQLQAEVLNGGFGQYFHNTAGTHAGETLRLLGDVGARKTARLLARACALFPDATPSPSPRARERQLKAIHRNVPQPFAREDAAFERTGEDLALLFMSSLDAAGRKAPATPPRAPRR